MSERRLGIIMNGVTGRMGTIQHLVRSVLAIRADGGVALANGDRVVPDPILVGRDAGKLAALAKAHGIARTTTDLDRALASHEDAIYFDAVTTGQRKHNLDLAIAAGKHVYCEKPTAASLADALDLVRRARAAGIRHGVVQDKLFLPGLVKLKRLIDTGFFGRILSVKGDFGYWVFEGDWQAAQRPSWNYRKSEAGGIVLDMLCHWRYVLDGLFGPMRAVSCKAANFIPERVDEQGKRYRADADDACFATFEIEGGIIAQINSAWTTRVRRDDLVTFQVDGTLGSAVAGLQRCVIQPRHATPSRSGTLTSCAPRISWRSGRRCRRTSPTPMASACSGSASSATCAKTRHSHGTCSRARAACSWRSLRSRAPPSGAGSTSPSSRSEPWRR